MKRILALVYGVVAYVLFLGTFLYAIGFIGNVGVPKSIDSGSSSSPLTAAIIDAVLLGLFALQHSIMARHAFKKGWTKVVSWHIERSTYVIAASVFLALLMWQWRPIAGNIWDVRGTSGEMVLVVLFWAGWATLLVSTFLINHFELFGLQQVWNYFRSREFHRPAFKTPVFYRLVRHPIYLGFLIAFWSTSHMTAGHLLFAIAASGYLFVGIHFEERDLLAYYGDAYRDYRRRVPMLIPFTKFPKKSPQQPKPTTA